MVKTNYAVEVLEEKYKDLTSFAEKNGFTQENIDKLFQLETAINLIMLNDVINEKMKNRG